MSTTHISELLRACKELGSSWQLADLAYGHADKKALEALGGEEWIVAPALRGAEYPAFFSKKNGMVVCFDECACHRNEAAWAVGYQVEGLIELELGSGILLGPSPTRDLVKLVFNNVKDTTFAVSY